MLGILGCGLLVTGLGMLLKGLWSYDRDRCEKNVMEVIYRKSELINRQGESVKFKKHIDKDYGYDVWLWLPKGITSKKLVENGDAFKEGLNLESVQFKVENRKVVMSCIEYSPFEEYKICRCMPNELYIGNGLTGRVKVDMNTYPHCLIGGDSGSGKSRMLLSMITNLIINDKGLTEIYLLQVRKNDLGVFRGARQVKAFSKSIDDVEDTLRKLDKVLIEREKLIDNTKGYYSIVDYNEEVDKKLPYIYVFIDEFSFLNRSRGDDVDAKAQKGRCLKYIKSIVNVGRSSGVFLVTSLQKPTVIEGIPSDIKAQLTTRVALKLLDSPTSEVILGNGDAVDLHPREFICRTLDQRMGYTATIEHKDIEELLIESLESNTADNAITTIEIKDINEVKELFENEDEG